MVTLGLLCTMVRICSDGLNFVSCVLLTFDASALCIVHPKRLLEIFLSLMLVLWDYWTFWLMLKGTQCYYTHGAYIALCMYEYNVVLLLPLRLLYMTFWMYFHFHNVATYDHLEDRCIELCSVEYASHPTTLHNTVHLREALFWNVLFPYRHCL